MKGKIGQGTYLCRATLPYTKRLLRLTTVSQEAKLRLRWIDHYQQHSNSVTVTSRHFGITRSLFYKWYGRWQRLGLKGLESQSSRPHHVRAKEIPLTIRLKAKQLREQNRSWSKHKIAIIMYRDYGIKISPSSINRIFHHYHLFWSTPNHNLDRRSRKWRITKVKAPVKLRGAAPGSLVEVDHKVLNHLGRTYYQFTAIDTCTKLKFIQVYTHKSALRGKDFIIKMLDFFPFRIRHINSDNGGEFLAVAHELLIAKKITHYFSRPHTPKDNPMVERTIQSDSYEFWYWGNMTTNLTDLRQQAQYWQDKFNYYRPHQALNYLTPIKYYEQYQQNQQ